MDFTAPPAALPPQATPPMLAMPQPEHDRPGSDLDRPYRRTAQGRGGPPETATVPEPQRPLASMLPLVDIPAGWEVSKQGPKHLETFNADKLFEKIDGRAESFTQNNVEGMAYSSYHPIGDDSNDVQVYIFEFDNSKPFRAKSKYNSEKPEESESVKVGTEGYASAGSLLFYADPFYTQIVSATPDPKYAAFSHEMAKRIAAKQVHEHSEGDEPGPSKASAIQGAIYALFPSGPNRGAPTYVASDVFGYSFLADVFMADFKDGSVTWQGFLRPYESADEAKAIFEKYVVSTPSRMGATRSLSRPKGPTRCSSARASGWWTWCSARGM